MKKFIATILLFTLIPLAIIALCDSIIQVKLLTHRPWEALIFSNLGANSPFYPNTTLEMNSVGDLCHHTKNSILKKENWKTDEIGFRNDQYIKEADVLIIGDSYTAGCSLDQTNTISNRICDIDRSLKVYNMAPSSITQFDKLLKTGKINKPKLIIFSIVERMVPAKISYYNINSKKEIIKEKLLNIKINAQIDYFLKFLPINWAIARVNGSSGEGIRGVNNSKMYFLRGTAQKHQKDDLANTVNTLITYKKYCDSLGIQFIFMPMPDKETVYYELVPFNKQPDYLFKLDSILNLSDVSTINTLKIYNDYRKTSDNILYNLDDTHWNSNATDIIALEIIRKVKKKS